MAGLAGGYMSLAYTPLWAENMTAGRGWIALALVVFATWRPFWLLGGAYLFGAIMYLSLYVQGVGRADPLAVDFRAALYRHRRGAGDHFARSAPHPPQSAGLPRQAVPCGGLMAQAANTWRRRASARGARICGHRQRLRPIPRPLIPASPRESRGEGARRHCCRSVAGERPIEGPGIPRSPQAPTHAALACALLARRLAARGVRRFATGLTAIGMT